nr:MAG TPA: hypothetical protein [Bacteriophage sp.]
MIWEISYRCFIKKFYTLKVIAREIKLSCFKVKLTTNNYCHKLFLLN